MVISFSNDKAWAHLVEKGYVVTFRGSRRKNPHGKTWCNRGRGEEKEFDVYVSEIKPVLDGQGLEEFASLSGFDTQLRWRVGILEMNNGEFPNKGYLYFVTRVEEEDE